MNRMQGFDPYTYQPLLRFFYDGTGEVSHGSAITKFARWLKLEMPEAYAGVMQQRPDLLNAGKAVASGAVGVQGLAGLGEANPAQSDPLSTWGNTMLDLAKGFMQYDTQRELLKVNLARAEQGLDPISGSMVAPQVNVGVSADLQKLGVVAVGGLIVVGLVAAMRRK